MAGMSSSSSRCASRERMARSEGSASESASLTAES